MFVSVCVCCVLCMCVCMYLRDWSGKLSGVCMVRVRVRMGGRPISERWVGVREGYLLMGRE